LAPAATRSRRERTPLAPILRSRAWGQGLLAPVPTDRPSAQLRPKPSPALARKQLRPPSGPRDGGAAVRNGVWFIERAR
jgi:hypothetical protein